MKNLLTFDVEEWFHANYNGISLIAQSSTSNFELNMEKILKICSDNNCKATFFVLGCIGEKHINVVRRISDEGHEVASHGYGHELAYYQSKEEFTEDVKKSVAILEDITGKKVFGYRAPSWSIIKSNYHYLEVLEKLGLRYDASVFPTKNFLYGIPNADRKICKPVIEGRQLELFEVTASVFDFFGRGMGYSGGFYFRFFPTFFIEHLIKKNNMKHLPTIVYMHPREIDAAEQKLKLPIIESFIHYYNVSGAQKKLSYITQKFEFSSIKDYLELK